MVVVDVVATDNKGRLIRGLGKDDFQVFERTDGWTPKKTPQTIAHFDYLERTGDVPPMLLVDAINTPQPYLSQMKTELEKLVDALHGRTQVAVFLLARSGELLVLQDFTDNRDLLRQAVDRGTKWNAYPDEDIGVRTVSTLGAFLNIADRMSGYTGRKKLIWVSGSFPVSTHSQEEAAKKTMAILAQTRLAIYPIQILGISPNDGCGQTKAKPNGTYWIRLDARFASTSHGNGAAPPCAITPSSEDGTMQDFANETGGLPCTGTNDFVACLLADVDDGATYYGLGYYPANGQLNGEYRQIVVTCSRKGVKLRYRQGYYARSEDAAASGKPTKQKR